MTDLERLGLVQFAGVQQFDDPTTGLALFTDPETGTTFSLRPSETLGEALARVKSRFAVQTDENGSEIEGRDLRAGPRIRPVGRDGRDSRDGRVSHVGRRDADAPGMSGDELAVWHEIRQREGRAQAIGLQELALATDVEARTVQRIIKHLIEAHHFPIGSVTTRPPGFYRIVTEDDQARAELQLTHRIIRTAQRLAALKRNTPAEVLGQVVLELEQA